MLEASGCGVMADDKGGQQRQAVAGEPAQRWGPRASCTGAATELHELGRRRSTTNGADEALDGDRQEEERARPR